MERLFVYTADRVYVVLAWLWMMMSLTMFIYVRMRACGSTRFVACSVPDQ